MILRPRQHLIFDEGYTLVEVLTVVAIMGVLVGLSIPATSSFLRREKLNVVTLEIAGWVEQVRNQAANMVNSVDSQGGCSVVFNHSVNGSAGQAIAQAASACTGIGSAELKIPAAEGASFQIRSSSGQNQTIVFTPRGMLRATPPLTQDFEYRFILADGRGPKRCVRITDITGTVDIGYGSDANLGSSCTSYGGL